MSRKPPRGEYIETDTGNKVSRKSQIIGTQNIILGGKSVIQAEVIIRGGLVRTLDAPGSWDREEGACGRGRDWAVLLPQSRMRVEATWAGYEGLSDHVFIGQNSIVEAAIVGNKVHIGKDCVIGKFALIKDCVRILDGTVVPPGMVIPSFSVVAGRPGRVVGEVPEGGEEALEGREIYRTIVN
ncbi:hypothetical protein VE04_06938 [Pseudogymnoascus sp. 24MN13]|nr:hypothetical protein VE04_06938 [Pseudogymnoascus sp. 24MN13]